MSPQETKPKHVFIVGCRRSGTTWTMLLMAQHAQVVAAQQVDFFRRLAHFGAWFEANDDYGMCLLTSRTADGLATQESLDGLARLPLAQALSKQGFQELVRPLANDVYARFAAVNPGCTAVVDQTPEYVGVWREILALFPDAYFLHVVRDPRSVFCSHRKAARSWADPTRFSCNPIDVAREWSDDVRRGREIAQATENYLELHYEDMRRATPKHVKRIFDWLDMSADDAFCEQAANTCHMDRVKGSGHAPRGFFGRGETEGWRRDMSAGELRCVEYVAGELMGELGYELVNAQPVPRPFQMRLRSASEGARYGLARWAWNDQGSLRRGASRVLKAFPGLRRVLLERLKRPA